MHCPKCHIAVADGDPEARNLDGNRLHGPCFKKINAEANGNTAKPFNLRALINSAHMAVNAQPARIAFRTQLYAL